MVFQRWWDSGKRRARRAGQRSRQTRDLFATEQLEPRQMMATSATLSPDLSRLTRVPVTFLRPDGSVAMSRSILIGQLNWSGANGDAVSAGLPNAFGAYCIDGAQPVSPGKTMSFSGFDMGVAAAPLGGAPLIGPARADLFRDFWRQFGPATSAGFTGGTDAAAFQLATWEIINDATRSGTKLSADLTSGSFSVGAAGRTLPAFVRAQQWLAAFDTTLPATRSIDIVTLTSAIHQDQAAAIPVVDLDVDSDSSGSVARSNFEESIEDDPTRPGVIVPVGGDRAKMVVDVPKGITATLAFDAAAAAKVKVFSPSGTVVLDQGMLSTPIVGGGPQTFWIEAFAPSVSMADIAFTLTPKGGSSASADTIRATAVAANLVAHRTGGRLGDVIPENLESAGDPNTYMILTNRDFEQGLPLAGRDFDDGVALLPPFSGPEGRVDDDLAKITLKRLPSGLNAGSVRLSVSHPDAVRLFKPVAGSMSGKVLPSGEWTASLTSAGYLAGLMSRDVDIWLEGLSMVKDFVFTVEYVAPSGSVLAADDVHILIADWTFRGSDGYEVPFVSPVWLDALLAATDSPKKPLADPTGAFYKIHIDGLAPQLVTQLLVASDSTPDFYTESYIGDTDTNNDGTIDAADGDFDTAYSSATVSRRFGVLHSAAHVLYAPEDPLVTPAQRQLIRDTLDLNVVHNDGLEATVVTPWDTQSDYLRKHGRFHWSLQENGTSVYAVGATIKGTIEWPERFFPKPTLFQRPIILFATTDEPNPQFTPLKFSHDGQRLAFEFAARREGYLRIVFCQKPDESLVVPIPYWQLSSILVRITADGTLPEWEAKAWDALKVDGFVPGDPINRNRQINTRYAEMYNSGISQDRPNPYGWFGIAAFVSTGAGVGMTTSMNFDAAPDAAGVDSRKVVDGLADGNLAIFIDVYKQALAYKSPNGLEELDRMLRARELRDKRQLDAWRAIHLGVFGDPAKNILPSQDDVDKGVRLLVQVEQDTTLQEVLNKDLPLWKAATDNLGTWIEENAARIGRQWRLFLMTSPIPGNYSSFQAYRSEDPTVPDDASFSDVNARLAWFDAKLFPAWKVWRAANPGEIVVSRLLRGGYHQ